MPFSCTRPKTKDDIYRNIQLEQRIDQSSEENIDLSSLNLTDEDITIIIQRAIRKKKCTTLSLATNKITMDGLQILVHHLKTKNKLTHLILSSNPIGDQGIKYIIQLITKNRTLHHLALSDAGITDQGMKSLAHALRSNKTLRSLDLRSNTLITDSSLDSLFQMVDTNEILSTCRLDNCGLSNEGKEKVKEVKSIKW